jgi:hypothetical protein
MANLAALNAATTPILIPAGETFDVSISGTFVGTVTIQRSKDSTTWFSVEDITTPSQKSGVTGSAWYYRATLSAYTSGTAAVDLYK